MNNLKELLKKDFEKAFKISSGNEEKFYYYMTCGSIIAFSNEDKTCFEIHGSTTAGKLFMLEFCIKTLASDLDISTDEIMEFLTGALKSDDEPF